MRIGCSRGTVTVYRRGLELNNYGLMIAKACDSQSSQLFSLRNYFPFYGIVHFVVSLYKCKRIALTLRYTHHTPASSNSALQLRIICIIAISFTPFNSGRSPPMKGCSRIVAPSSLAPHQNTHTHSHTHIHTPNALWSNKEPRRVPFRLAKP